MNSPFCVLRSIGTRGFVLLALATLLGVTSSAQENRPWNGRVCAVSLTYDDALNVHLDNVVPALDSVGFKATFYLSGFFPSFRNRLDEWRSVAAKGHELGNHTLYHPCEGAAPGREWVKPDYDLNNYTVQRLADEITMANVLLHAVDGRKERTFAYPCGDKMVREASYVAKIQSEFVAERGVSGKTQTLSEVDLTDVGSYVIAGQNGEQLIALVKEAMAKKGLVVFLFHGVGGEHDLDVSLEAHRQLLRYLKDHEKDIWVAPLVDIGRCVRDQRK